MRKPCIIDRLQEVEVSDHFLNCIIVAHEDFINCVSECIIGGDMYGEKLGFCIEERDGGDECGKRLHGVRTGNRNIWLLNYPVCRVAG